jgi:hypothetical protein
MNNNDCLRLQASIIFLLLALIAVTAIIRLLIGSVTYL